MRLAARASWLVPALVLALTSGCEREAAREQAPREQAPLELLDLDGHPRDPLVPDDRADVFVFLRTDCPISNRYAPKLGRIAAQFADAPLDVWLIYVDPDETPSVIREHMQTYALPGVALRDPARGLVARAGATVTPSVAVFDAGGVRRYHGRIDDWYVDYGQARVQASSDELLDAIEAVLAGRPPSVAFAEPVGCPLPPL
ncbi:hypothetical protein [Enhygromyxa salina]|uniref:Thioredoxin domain-containing protein n=1 Tax=Enhygromyxa salina TaxID=215803 RepID=A0A2S9YMY4_9BACT|nr:hypothetical protein [Enhygromyxa salina]PRQ06458.1 hypothetical protein ENSA7_37770 [Enhygromyxa salina]